jgi:hypothetical protein
VSNSHLSTRLLTLGWSLGGLLTVALVVVSLLVAVQNSNSAAQTARTAARIHASQLHACRASNVARHQDIAIWNRLLTLTPAQLKRATAEQKAEVRDLEHLVGIKDHPVNCAVLYKS